MLSKFVGCDEGGKPWEGCYLQGTRRHAMSSRGGGSAAVRCSTYTPSPSVLASGDRDSVYDVGDMQPYYAFHPWEQAGVRL